MRIGVIGAAGITGRALIEPARKLDEVQVAAVAARDPERAAKFAEEHEIPVVHRSYAELLADDSLDAIYVPLANSLHAQWTIAALEAGHHVLCEKPFASNAAQAAEMVATAERTGRVLVEAYHWRYHPVADRMLDLARAVGPLEELETRFSISIPPENIRYDLALAGGSFMDLGCYCMHIARTIAGGNPRVISATAVEGPKGIDLSMETNLKFGDSLDAVVSCSMIGETSWPESMFVRARGRGGQLEVLNPMAPQWGHRIQAELADGTTVDEVIEAAGTSYDYQLRAFCRAVSGEEEPLTGGADAVATMAAIDGVYTASGLGIRR
jgi:predicted dehydrogenase